MITDEPVRGAFAYLEHPGLLALSGLEQMRRFQRRELPYAPVYYLAGANLVEVAEGSCTWRLPATPWLRSAAGIPTGGVLAFLADYATGGAVHTTVPAGTSWATLDLKVNFLRPVPPDGRRLEAHGTVVHRGRTIAVTTCEIRTAEGKTAAIATGSTMILPDRPWRIPTAPIDETVAEEG